MILIQGETRAIAARPSGVQEANIDPSRGGQRYWRVV